MGGLVQQSAAPGADRNVPPAEAEKLFYVSIKEVRLAASLKPQQPPEIPKQFNPLTVRPSV
jgi:hypothetical protein